ncbi:MAG: acireductone synthase [Methylococcaceae bacterium]|nr:acireductone synthase [Methylococcaceae bacterium]
MIRAILTDIEGTTSSIAFVKEVLFPYASAHLAEFVHSHGSDAEVRRSLDEVSEICGQRLNDGEAIAQLLRWIEEDRKLTPLKALQGLIWEEGYRHGDFFGHLYPDAARKLREWKEQGLALYIFSSGSVYAQKLLFGHTEHGDLTPLFCGYFDTSVGAKQAADSYRKIAERIGFAADEILFLSDVDTELDAARAAGMQTCQLLRQGTQACQHHPLAVDFDGIIVSR